MELSTQIVIICLTIKVEPGRYKSGQNKSHTRFENRSNFPLILPEYLTPELNSVLYGTSSHQEVLYVFARRHCDRPGVKLDSSGCWGWAQEGNSPLRRPLRVSSKKTLRQKTIPFPQSSWASGRKNSRIEVKRKMKESCWLHRLITDCVTVCVCVCDRHSACYPACCGGQWGQRLWVVTSCPLAGGGYKKRPSSITPHLVAAGNGN